MTSTQRTPTKSVSRSNLVTTELICGGSESEIDKILTKKVSRRTKRKVDQGTDSDEHVETTVVMQMREMFEEFERKQASKLESVVEAINTIKNQNIEILESIDFLSQKYDHCIERLDVLEQENQAYKRRIEHLESRIEQTEQNSRTSMVEIRNIPKQTNETKEILCGIVKTFGEVVEQPITDADISDVYRLKTKNESKNHILVQFTTTIMKNAVLRKCRTYNKNNKSNKLNTSHLKLPGNPEPVFVDESLTLNTKRLHYLTRVFVKDNQYHSCWTSYGNVYLKQFEYSTPIRITTDNDLRLLTK